jgi:cytochrome c biogenesis protein CcmG, thiol:disulfide interchange protein DsbE
LKRKLLTTVVLAFIVGLLILFARPDYRQGEPSLAGSSARDFAFDLAGKPEHLSDLRGKVVVLNFWATWCPPCVEEAPALNQLQAHIATGGGTVLGISVDDDAAAYDQFLRSYRVNFPTFRDSSKKIAATYGTSMYPETYVIDRQGRIDRKIVGPQNWTGAEMTSYLDSLLAKK